MNLMLADIRSLTLEFQEISPGTDTSVDSFAGLFQQNLTTAPEGNKQAVDIKGLFQNIPMTSADSAVASPAWREFLSQNTLEITNDSDAKFANTLGLDEIQLNQPIERVVQIVPNAPKQNPGEPLPVTGNSLPHNSATPLANQAIVAKTTVYKTEVRPESSPLSGLPRVNNAATPVEVADPPRLNIATKLASVTGARIAPSETVVARDTPVRENHLRENVLNPVHKAIPYQTRLSEIQPASANHHLRAIALQSEVKTGAEIAVFKDPLVLVQKPLARPTLAALDDRMTQAPKVTRENSVVKELLKRGALTPRENTSPVFDPVKALVDGLTPDSMSLRGTDIAHQASTNTTAHTFAAVTPTAVAGNASSTPQANASVTFETFSSARHSDAIEWGNGLGERISWMINQKQNTATLRLDPPLLGKLDVQIKIADDATVITIQTQHAQTRELIESASFRLRDFLQENGYQNVNVDVSHQDQQQTCSHDPSDIDADTPDDHDPETGAGHHEPAHRHASDQLLDTFA